MGFMDYVEVVRYGKFMASVFIKLTEQPPQLPESLASPSGGHPQVQRTDQSSIARVITIAFTGQSVKEPPSSGFHESSHPERFQLLLV